MVYRKKEYCNCNNAQPLIPTPELSLQNWIAFVFDHPVHGDQPAWHWSLDAPDWQDTPEHITGLITETFERSGELLSGFSDAQLNQGFWFQTPTTHVAKAPFMGLENGNAIIPKSKKSLMIS